jgi:ribosomal protein S27E
MLLGTERDGMQKTFDPPESADKKRVGCVSCSQTLLETFVETPEGSRVWLRVRCKRCGVFNKVLYLNGKVQVAQE